MDTFVEGFHCGHRSDLKLLATRSILDNIGNSPTIKKKTFIDSFMKTILFISITLSSFLSEVVDFDETQGVDREL